MKGQEMKKHQFFVVPIGDSKNYRKMEFHPRAPVLKSQ